jgi:hypothetical protein
MKRWILIVAMLTACGKKAPAASPCEAIKPTAEKVVVAESARQGAEVQAWATSHLDQGVAVFFEGCKAKHWDQPTIDCIVAATPDTFGACLNAMSFEQSTDLKMRVKHYQSRMKTDLAAH